MEQGFTVALAMAVPEETPFEEMKRYVRFSDADARTLASLLPHLAPCFERVAVAFYDRIREHEGAREVLKDEAQIERLERSLVKWLRRICTGPYDEAYCEETAKIGRMHVRVGLPQHYMLTAMALIREALLGIAESALGTEASRPARDALNRVLDLELAVMLDAYRDDYVARVQNEKLAAAATLASELAHEIRNPLNGARLHLTLLERGLKRAGVADVDTLEAVKVVGDEIGRLGELAREFLDVARPNPSLRIEPAGEDRAPDRASPPARLKG